MLTKKYTIEVWRDRCPTNPRKWDNLGIMICKHSQYRLGDVRASKDYRRMGSSSREDMAQYFYDYVLERGYFSQKYVDGHGHLTDDGVDAVWKLIDKEVIMLPLYLYDHSGLTMNTTGFHSPWDSGQVGFIYAPRDKVYKEYGWKRLTRSRLAKIREYLEAEVEAYDQYLTGEVYGYTISAKVSGDAAGGVVVDSCGGFYGREYCESEAAEIVRHCQDDDRKRRQNKLKALIKAKAPVWIRGKILDAALARI